MFDEASLEQTVQSMVPLLKPHFVEKASKTFHTNVTDLEFTATQTETKIGASGQVLISTIYYRTDFGESSEEVALKYFHNESSAITEIRNAMDLEIKFKAAPEFGIPRVIFASTKNPVLIIYEGIKGKNYDEIDIPSKAREAGRLLATIHGSDARPVDEKLYRDLSRMIGTHLSTTGMEKEISQGLGNHFQKLEGSLSGCNPFSDFHQSNVMLATNNHQITKTYIIDPEFMQKGSFDRLEDVGTFFGLQMLDEFKDTGNINNTIEEVNEFLLGYQEKNLENGGLAWTQIYSRGSPLAFFISQWALMDALDIAMNRGGDLTSPETQSRLKFTIFILSGNKFKFPKF